ncbi:MAG: MBL fold metallo-hydrolase [Hydrogenophaga sp.]|jgi:glyoxylase-like metal-dependent hydrolase (beta-lactamase superfamily II)|uniref:MBL fold metallo-hydrolase n=1 Tax=Hydrogenophaga sp. TaxID=1904254 RepID=UPI00271EEF5A|nr:MBL fold metallo-hydrolase [Hydrogenophaga sp.]MDO9480335.1 MBL fold metallo-hydrolase [Hydrogenophaga sp.]MDP3343622.1 MBL fold metallo-hydrolase [Hydrogenophaga sp.]MDP3807027.1 MBL fold metallo-hydrolase [Hydrogenophaga sp.]MDZ4238153.1 MBL fold metallo-hydrolase [Hydrogenophaga sp.]
MKPDTPFSSPPSLNAPTAVPLRSRRQWLRMVGGTGLSVAGLAMVPDVRLFAQQVQEFIEGPPVPDVAPEQLSPHVWMVYAKDGFPTAENQGLMASVLFVITQKGVVVLDTGASLQIGQMAIRMIKKVTSKPVVAVFNSHYHGDHWLGNHAFVEAYGKDLPIHALAHTREQIAGHEGNLWRSLMERWTNQATLGTKVFAPNNTVQHGQVFDYGDVQIKLHHYGRAHTPSDLCLEIVQDKLTYIGDIAMDNRIANMDDGSYLGTFKYYDAIQKAAGDQLWVPGHGRGSKTLLDTYGTFMRGIYEPCEKAVKEGVALDGAKARVLQDPRVASRAKTMDGFDSNIGKYTSLAYLEAEKEAF